MVIGGRASIPWNMGCPSAIKCPVMNFSPGDCRCLESGIRKFGEGTNAERVDIHISFIPSCTGLNYSWRKGNGRCRGRGYMLEFVCNDSRVGSADGEKAAPPASRGEAVEQSAASLHTLLSKYLTMQGPSTIKQRRAQRRMRLRVEIPVLDESPAASLSLTLDLLSAFFSGKENLGPAAVYFSEPDLVQLASEISLTSAKPRYHYYMSLTEAAPVPQGSVVVFIVSPTFALVPLLSRVVESAQGRPVVLLNPNWSQKEEEDASWAVFFSSFDVAYSYTPLSIQGFLSMTEGAVLKHVRSGAPEGRPWLLFVKDSDSYKCVSSLKHRPGPMELENALYSSTAANSPVTKSIQFLRGLLPKQNS